MTSEHKITYLTHAFHKMLNNAEEMFGERDKSWTFIGIEFRDDGPYIMYYPKKRISIVLSTGCSQLMPNDPQLYYQLSHEVSHLLYPIYPTKGNEANVLVEGISTYFSKIYLDTLSPYSNYAIENISKSKYYKAYTLVEKLIS
jgi:hypothetical protein